MTVSSATDSISPSEKAHPPTATFSILSRLRLETRAEHNALDKLLDLMNTRLTLQSYARQLKQFYGFYAPLEQALQARRNLLADGPDGITLPDVLSQALLARLNKTSYLQQDLQYLGIPTDDQLLCRNLLPLRTQADVLGCLYVLEGATLGGAADQPACPESSRYHASDGRQFFSRVWRAHWQHVAGYAPVAGGWLARQSERKLHCGQRHCHFCRPAKLVRNIPTTDKNSRHTPCMTS